MDVATLIALIAAVFLLAVFAGLYVLIYNKFVRLRNAASATLV